jgi:type IV pilus assembly protein PilC
VEAIQHTARALPNRYFTERLAGVSQLIAKGASLTAAITGTELLPTAAEKIVEAGERSGALEEQLLELAEFYESDIDYQLGLALSLVEPLLILITGIIVGGIVVVMYLPIFSLAGAIS